MGRIRTTGDIAGETFLSFGTERLLALCDAVTGTSASAQFVAVFRRLLRGWGDDPIGQHPRLRSNVADDGAPFEFSLALSAGAPEVQFYVEAQARPPTLASNMAAGRTLLGAVAEEFGVSIERLRSVEALFFPDDPSPPFTIWIGVSWAPGRPVAFKVYLNPQVRGRDRAFALTEEAMGRLGFDLAWARARAALAEEGDRHDEIGIVALDLSGEPDARVKIYVRHHRATVADIEAIARIAPDYRLGEAARFYSTLAGHLGPFLKKAPLTEFSFVDRQANRPSSVTLEFPIGSYVATDEVAHQRIQACLAAFELPQRHYEEAIRSFATRGLAERSGLHAHVTLRRVNGGPRVALYFASEAYSPTPNAPSLLSHAGDAREHG